MSRTRILMEELRRRLGAADPMPPRAPVPSIARPPAMVYAVNAKPHGDTDESNPHTTALLGIGHVGTRYATDVVLQFQAELAVAHEAVATELPDGWAEHNGLVPLSSECTSHREFLLRPDLGRRLNEASRRVLERNTTKDADVQLILADGLSATAVLQSGLTLLNAVKAACEAKGLRVGVPVCAKFARVWLEDEIGELTGARVAVILIGERPGLGTGDGLSAYLVYGPQIGKTDGDRNMMSNIHARGTPPVQAAERLVAMIQAMLTQGISGVDLDLSSMGEAAASVTAYREPQVRQRLVEVP